MYFNNTKIKIKLGLLKYFSNKKQETVDAVLSWSFMILIQIKNTSLVKLFSWQQVSLNIFKNHFKKHFIAGYNEIFL